MSGFSEEFTKNNAKWLAASAGDPQHSFEIRLIRS